VAPSGTGHHHEDARNGKLDVGYLTGVFDDLGCSVYLGLPLRQLVNYVKMDRRILLAQMGSKTYRKVKQNIFASTAFIS
jgi:hypothetical protein